MNRANPPQSSAPRTSKAERPEPTNIKEPEADEVYNPAAAQTASSWKRGPETNPTEPIPPDETLQPIGPPPSVDPPPPSPWFSVFWLLLACVALWGIGSATLNLIELWHRHSVIAVPIAAAGAALIGLLARAMWREWQAMQDIDALAERRNELNNAIEAGDIDRVRLALAPTLKSLQSSRPELMDEFERAIVDQEDCRDYLHALEHLVLTSLDEEAGKVVKQGSISTAAGVAIIPHPAFDAIFVLWRALAMTRQIGGIYGLRPGGLSSWRLLSYSIKSAALAATMDTLLSMIADASANAIASALKPLAEGAVIGARTYRFGQITIGICRPVEKKL